MRRFFQKYKRKLLTGYGIAVVIYFAVGISFLATKTESLVDLLASSISSFGGSTTTIFFSSYGDTTLLDGGTTSIDININTRVAINALGATIAFPKDMLEIVGISKEKSFFNLWTEDTSISEDAGEIHFSGGTTKQGGIMGTGTVITLLVRAKNIGIAQLHFTNLQVYPSDDTGVAIDTTARTISYIIEDQKPASAGTPPPTTVQSNSLISASPATPPSADFNKDGKIDLVDFSILTFKMFRPYDPLFDLNVNGSVGLDDLSILLSKI